MTDVQSNVPLDAALGQEHHVLEIRRMDNGRSNYLFQNVIAMNEIGHEYRFPDVAVHKSGRLLLIISGFSVLTVFWITTCGPIILEHRGPH